MVITAATGSTAPERTPYQNVFDLDIPSPLKGIDTMAPSGKFWIAIPIANAKAPAALTRLLPATRFAYTTPTAMPSGMLWSVTARISFVVLLSVDLGPSPSLFICM